VPQPCIKLEAIDDGGGVSSAIIFIKETVLLSLEESLIQGSQY
jgi:hypothetical protein